MKNWMCAPLPWVSAFWTVQTVIWMRLNEKIYTKITTLAKDLVSTGKDIERDFGIPIVNKRISVTPIALVGGAACKKPEDFVTIAKTLDRAAKGSGSKLYRRLFCTGKQGHDHSR